MKKKTYPTFQTFCMKCQMGIEVPNFNVHVGMYSFALCPKDFKKFLDDVNLFTDGNLYD